MNRLIFKTTTSLLLFRHHNVAPRIIMGVQRRMFSQSSMGQVINQFYSRGEAEEVSISSVTKTMADILKTQITMNDHKEYHPVSEELAYYVVKLL